MGISRKKTKILFLALISVQLLLAHYAHSRVYIDITAPILRKIPIAIKGPLPSPDTFENRLLARKLYKILKDDLLFHGFFKIIDTGQGTSHVPIEYFITGRFFRQGDRITVEFRLFDARGSNMLVGRRYRGSKDAYTIRKIAHRFTDLLIYEITGEHGVSLSKISFVVAGKRKKDIFMADFDGYNLRRLTTDGAIKLSPRISPDGRYLVYTSYRSGKPCLYIQGLRDRSLHMLSSYKGINIAPSWHPKSNYLAVTLSKDGNPDLYLMDLTGKILARLTKGPGINCSPSWSPDGEHLVFVSDRYGSPQLFIMDVKTRAVKRLTYQGRYNTYPEWSPRGDRIVYTGRVNGGSQVFTISPEGGDPVQLTYSGTNENPSWSPDGRQIVFTSDRLGKRSIFVMDANGRRQRRLISIKGAEALCPFWGPNCFK